jgi:Amt family ammonium transporter
MSDRDVLWVLVAAALVFLMQVGFLCLETGFTRVKNNVNVASKNLTDFCLSSIVFWAVGFGLMFGASRYNLVGTTHFLHDFTLEEVGFTAFFIFQIMFCGTAVTIISGAVAERMKFVAYLVMTVVVSGLIYPVFGHLAWGGLYTGAAVGMLANQGFYDFAGSTVVHSVGGWAGLAILLIIGPRHGRFEHARESAVFRPSSMPIAALGTLLLFVGWMGFNGGSTLALNEQVPVIVLNTLLAGSAGALSAGILAFGVANRLDAVQFMNGCLGGLVAITAGANVMSQEMALLVGFIGGMMIIAVEETLEYFRVDDAVGAIPVHLGAGIWGTLAVGLYGDLDLIDSGLSRGEQILAQLTGVATCALWTFSIAYVVMRLINRVYPLRVTLEDEIRGLNLSEHGIEIAHDHEHDEEGLRGRLEVVEATLRKRSR